MNLYFNGCSHTVGLSSDIHDIKQTYPYKLSNILNANFINSALPRSSNDRIFRTTIEDICSLNNKPDIAIIQWSYYDRFETPLLTNDFDKLKLPWKEYRLRDLEWKQYNPYVNIETGISNTNIEVEWKEHKKNSINSFLTKAIALDIFIKSNNIRPIHIFFPSTMIKKDNDLIKTLLKYNTDSFINTPLLGMETCLDSEGFKRGSDNHFLESAHDRIVEWLYDFIKYNKPLQYKYPEPIKTNEHMFIYEE